MSRHRVAGGLAVRGTCKDGHVTEATTDPGRVTWEGTCAHDGCEHKVKARTRATAATASPAPASPDEPPAPVEPAPPKKPRVRQVDYDAQPRKRDQPRRTSDAGAAAEPAAPAAVHRGTDDPAPAGGKPGTGAGEPAASAERRRGIRWRITGRREAEPPAKATREFRLPF